MEVIAEIEGQGRGVYCGSIGYFGFNGQVDLNIAIRTAMFSQGTARFQGGGGITARSEPAAEYEETLTKITPHHGGLRAMILIVDNYDSFVYNIARYFEELGQQVVVKRNDAVGEADLKAKAIVISPGPCTPHEAGKSLGYCAEVFRPASHSRRLPWAPVHWRSLWRQGLCGPNAPCMGIHPRSFMMGPAFSKACPTASMRGAIIR